MSEGKAGADHPSVIFPYPRFLAGITLCNPRRSGSSPRSRPLAERLSCVVKKRSVTRARQNSSWRITGGCRRAQPVSISSYFINAPGSASGKRHFLKHDDSRGIRFLTLRRESLAARSQCSLGEVPLRRLTCSLILPQRSDINRRARDLFAT